MRTEKLYRTIKVPLKKIIKNPSKNVPKIDQLVKNINKIVIRAYQLNRLFILTRIKNKEEIPLPTNRFCHMLLSTVSDGKKSGRESKDSNMKELLLKFYDSDYKPLLGNDNNNKIPAQGYSAIFQKLSEEMSTSYSNNVLNNFFKNLKNIIVMKLDERIDRFVKDKELRKENRKQHSKRCKELLDAIYKRDKNLVVPEFQDIYDFANSYIPNHKLEKSLEYDFKANTLKYFSNFIAMANLKEQLNRKMFQSISIRNNMVPKYIPIDIKSLIYIMNFKNFCGRSKSELVQEYAKNKSLERSIWSRYFKIDSKATETTMPRCFSEASVFWVPKNVAKTASKTAIYNVESSNIVVET